MARGSQGQTLSQVRVSRKQAVRRPTQTITRRPDRPTSSLRHIHRSAFRAQCRLTFPTPYKARTFRDTILRVRIRLLRNLQIVRGLAVGAICLSTTSKKCERQVQSHDRLAHHRAGPGRILKAAMPSPITSAAHHYLLTWVRPKLLELLAITLAADYLGPCG